VAALQAQGLDIGSQRFGYPQPVESQQGHQGVLDRGAQPSCHQQGADLVSIQGNRVGFVVEAGPAHVYGWGMVEEALLFRVSVEAGHGT
jgi:hypothetical protein